jgi:hypothetical protein
VVYRLIGVLQIDGRHIRKEAVTYGSEEPQGLFFVVIVFATAATQHGTWIRVRMKTFH